MELWKRDLVNKACAFPTTEQSTRSFHVQHWSWRKTDSLFEKRICKVVVNFKTFSITENFSSRKFTKSPTTLNSALRTWPEKTFLFYSAPLRLGTYSGLRWTTPTTGELLRGSCWYSAPMVNFLSPWGWFDLALCNTIGLFVVISFQDTPAERLITCPVLCFASVSWYFWYTTIDTDDRPILKMLLGW